MRVHNFKFRKIHKVRALKRLDYKNLSLLYGLYGLRSLESKRLLDIQLFSAQGTIKKKIKKSGIIWPRVHLTRFITKKPGETRMGKGKGSFSNSVCVVQKGSILFELGGPFLKKKLALEALRLASSKLPIKTEIILYKS
ncbi:UNVERIFIED_CONTAM: hypothetical protein GTU68_036241 [Idotea baltica]|nr:hypothetical protein [Idotea baltica]